MKQYLDNINKVFENKIRLGIMSALMVNDSMDFKSLKALLDVTDGNLASHLKTLEKADYIKVSKQFIGRKPNTKYLITVAGQNAFRRHVAALEAFIKNNLN